MSRTATTTLASLSLFAAYAKYYQSFRNGFIGLLSDMADNKSLSGLPGGLKCEYTGFTYLDRFLTSCNVFFWPIFQGDVPNLLLYGVAFASAVIPMWLVIVVETHRGRSPVVAFMELAFLAGPLVQCLGPGLVIPAMLSRLHVPPRVTKLPFGFDIGFHPSSMIIAYILPLVFAALPTPGVTTYETKQKLIAFWQGWFVYASLIMLILRYLRPVRSSQDLQLKIACAFAFACSTAGHLVFLCFARAKTASYHVFLPPAPWGDLQVTNIEAGVLRFLQWDYTLSALAMLVWTVASYSQATGRRNCLSSWILLILGMAGVILLGPCSVAMVLYRRTLTSVTEKGRHKL